MLALRPRTLSIDSGKHFFESSLLVVPALQGRRRKRAPICIGHVTCPRVAPRWAHRRRKGAAAAGPSMLRAPHPTPAQGRVHTVRGVHRASEFAPPCIQRDGVSAAWGGHLVLGLRVRRARRHTEPKLVSIERADHHACHRRSSTLGVVGR